MQISPIRNRYTNNNNFQLNRKKIKTSQILFTGNDTVERKRFGKDIFVHQTALFREPITDRFVQNYVMDNFCDKHEINIVSGACSSGEEVYSYACMLNDSGKKINIMGFDISKKIIKIAKKGIIKVKNYRQNYGRKVLTSEDFLLDDSILTSYKKKCKNNFFKYFKPQSEKETLQLPSYLYKMQKQRCENIEQLIEIFGKYDFSKIEEKIKSMYNDLILNNTYEMQTFKFDFAKASNCNIYFKHGDVLKLDKLFKKKNSVDVLLYRNAL